MQRELVATHADRCTFKSELLLFWWGGGGGGAAALRRGVAEYAGHFCVFTAAVTMGGGEQWHMRREHARGVAACADAHSESKRYYWGGGGGVRRFYGGGGNRLGHALAQFYCSREAVEGMTDNVRGRGLFFVLAETTTTGSMKIWSL